MGLPIEVDELFSREEINIISLEPRDDYSIIVTFDNGEVRLYEMKDKLKGVLEILKDIDKFKEAFIDDRGNIAWDRDKRLDSSVVWNNRIDICKDAVYLKSKIVQE